MYILKHSEYNLSPLKERLIKNPPHFLNIGPRGQKFKLSPAATLGGIKPSEKNKLDIKSIILSRTKELREMIRPSGFYNQKADRLKTISRHIAEEYNRNLDNFFNKDLRELRAELLSLNGIGEHQNKS